MVYLLCGVSAAPKWDVHGGKGSLLALQQDNLCKRNGLFPRPDDTAVRLLCCLIARLKLRIAAWNPEANQIIAVLGVPSCSEPDEQVFITKSYRQELLFRTACLFRRNNCVSGTHNEVKQQHLRTIDL